MLYATSLIYLYGVSNMAFIYWRMKNSARRSMGCVYHHHHLLCIGFWRTPLQWGMSANDATAEQSKLQAERGTRRSATSCGAARVATGIASLHLTIQTTKATLPLVGWLAGYLVVLLTSRVTVSAAAGPNGRLVAMNPTTAVCMDHRGQPLPRAKP